MKYIALLTTIFCLVAGCTTTATFPVNENLTVNDDEKVLWCRAQEEQKIIDDSGLLYREPELERYLNRIARKLQPKDIPANMSLQIKVIKDPNLNAFAFPNGVIYVHTGILARMDNEAQLAALLAHEITHCTHKHTLRVFKSIKDRPKFISAVQETLARMALAQELAKLLGLTGSMAAVTGYTRELETEADRVGLDLMVKADYDTREAFHLFKHLKQEIENHGIKEPFFSEHTRAFNNALKTSAVGLIPNIQFHAKA